MKINPSIPVMIFSVFLFASIFFSFVSIRFNFFGENVVSLRGYELAQVGGYLTFIWIVPVCAAIVFCASLFKHRAIASIASIVSMLPLLVFIYSLEHPTILSNVKISSLDLFINNFASVARKNIYMGSGYYLSWISAILCYIYSNLMHKESSKEIMKKAVESDIRECPYCAEKIKAKAIKCRFCGSAVSPIVFEITPEPIKLPKDKPFSLVRLLILLILGFLAFFVMLPALFWKFQLRLLF